MAGSIPVHLRQFFVFTPILVLALLLHPSTAHGQARLLSSTPVEGASLSGLDEIVFEFDTLLVETGAEVTVTKLDGTSFAVSSTSVEGTVLRAAGPPDLPSGNYQVSYSVQSSDGAVNVGSVRISVDAPAQALSGGLFVLVAIAFAMVAYMGLVFRADKSRRRRGPS